MKHYTAVFADLDNTILDFSRSEHRAVRAVLKKHGLPDDAETAKIYAGINQKWWEAYERGEILREAIFAGRFRTLLETLNLPGNAEKISEDYFTELADGHDVIPGAVAFLDWLREKNIRVYATTNGVARTQYKRLDDAGLTERFDAVFVSEDIGAQKPSLQYFQKVLAQIPENREAILLIGDSISSDIMGGITAGIDTCWYNPNGKTATVVPTYTVKNFDEIKNIL